MDYCELTGWLFTNAEAPNDCTEFTVSVATSVRTCRQQSNHLRRHSPTPEMCRTFPHTVARHRFPLHNGRLPACEPPREGHPSDSDSGPESECAGSEATSHRQRAPMRARERESQYRTSPPIATNPSHARAFGCSIQCVRVRACVDTQTRTRTRTQCCSGACVACVACAATADRTQFGERSCFRRILYGCCVLVLVCV